MLHNLTLTNFKSWACADLTFGRITGLFGTNSSGKSSLLQFLLMMKQTKEATDRNVVFELNGPYVSLGVFKDVIHRHDETRDEIPFGSDSNNLIFESNADSSSATRSSGLDSIM